MSFTGNAQSQLFELDRVEIALTKIFTDQGLPAERKRNVDTQVTPRIELELTPEVVEGRRYAFPGDTDSRFSPLNTWSFRLAANVTTNREQNSEDHLPLVGLTRWNLQMFRLKDTFTREICPTHIIIEIREQSCAPDVWNEGGMDVSRMTFAGFFAIRDSAW